MRMLLIDSHCVFSAIFRSMSADGQKISAEEFFESCFQSLKKHIKNKSATHVVFCIDDYSRSWRREVLPGYRQDRFRLPGAFLPKLPIFIKRLKGDLGVLSISCSNSESYDVIATIVAKVSSSKNIIDVSILASDSRLYCLLDDNVSMFYPYGQDSGVIKTKSWLEQTYGFLGNKWVDYLSLCGDSHKRIPGIPGVGKKKAHELLTEFEMLENIYFERSTIGGALGATVREHIDYVINVVRPVLSLKSNLDLSMNLKDCRLLAVNA
jgi:5'-3' exonuclease